MKISNSKMGTSHFMFDFRTLEPHGVWGGESEYTGQWGEASGETKSRQAITTAIPCKPFFLGDRHVFHRVLLIYGLKINFPL